MKLAVYRYTLLVPMLFDTQQINVNEEFSIAVPERYKFLHVGRDGYGGPCLWIEVDPTAPLKDLTIVVVHDERPFEVRAGASYLGTVVWEDDVYHVYFLPEKKEKR